MKNQVLRTLVFQFLAGGIYLAGVGLWDAAELPSALVGCVASLLPNTYFGLRMLQAANNDNDATAWLGYAYRAEIGKWVIMGSIVALAFTSNYSWDPVVFFAGFVLMQISGLFVPLIRQG